MCWTNCMAIPIVLKKPLRVYKVGTLATFYNFISLYYNFVYRKCQTMPTVEIDPEFERLHPSERISNQVWCCNRFNIYKGYHSYLTKEIAKLRSHKYDYDDIGIFEIPADAIIYVNYRSREVVSTDIKYLGLLEE